MKFKKPEKKEVPAMQSGGTIPVEQVMSRQEMESKLEPLNHDLESRRKEEKSGEMGLVESVHILTDISKQVRLWHWQTESYAQHRALGSLYEAVEGFQDQVAEMLMGYGMQIVAPNSSEKPVDLSEGIDIKAYLMDKRDIFNKFSEESSEMKDLENKFAEVVENLTITIYLLNLK